MDERTGYTLQVELLMTLRLIHPWLINIGKTCAAKCFAEEEMRSLQKSKFNQKKGSKVKYFFFLSLIACVVQKEKSLIFSNNLAKMRFLIDLFEKFYQWKNVKEILVLTGELDLFERGKAITIFEDPHNISKILHASINAFFEIIRLTTSSRVIFQFNCNFQEEFSSYITCID